MRHLFSLLTVLSIIFMVPNFAGALTLEEAIVIALEQNPSLKQTRSSIDSAAESLNIAKGRRGFTLSLSGSADASKNEGVDLSESASTRVGASVPIYSGGQLEANIKAADLYLEVSKLNYAQAADDLVYKVAVAYVDALEANATHSVDLETRDNLASHEQLISDLFNAGSKAKIDLLRAQVETSNAQQDAVKSQASYEVALTNLATLLSFPQISNITLTDIADANFPANPFVDDDTANAALLDLENYISTAEQHRANLQADYLQVERGEQLLKSAKAAWLPSLSASASTGLNAQSDSWKPTSNATAGLTASWNIFDSHVTRAEVETAKIEIQRLQLALQDDIDSVHSEVVTAYKNLSSALSRLNTTQSAVNLAVEERYIATERYRAGEGILLDILDAEVALSTAKKNHVSAKYDVLRYRFALNHALGNTFSKQLGG